MSKICPTVTVETKHDFEQQLNIALKLSRRVHIDVSDGSLAPRNLLGLGSMRWPGRSVVDIHVMSTHPHAEVAIACELKPHLVIIHAEASEELGKLMDKLQAHAVKAGIALLAGTSVELVAPLLKRADHVLIFSGNLGYQGGSSADLGLLTKVSEIKALNPKIEIGWDGGVNELNVAQLAAGGVEIINSGSYLQHAPKPKIAYAKLELELKSKITDGS